MASRPQASSQSLAVFMRSLRWTSQASIKGMAIFIISEGWMRVMPRLSQRVAPLEVSPATSTANKSKTPNENSGMASRCI